MTAFALLNGDEDVLSNPDATDLHKHMLAEHSRNGSDVVDDKATYRFLFVRHPLVRLASAYNDKFATRREAPFVKPVADYKVKNNDIILYLCKKRIGPTFRRGRL
jgi:hypothetical protein